MHKWIYLALAFNFYTFSSFAQTALLQNVYNRPVTSLNGEWRYIVDPYENGYYNYRYEPFDQQETPWSSAFFLNSKVQDSTELYFNGKKLGEHIGGFTPFNFEITSLIEDEENFLVVKVDNKRLKEGVPTLNTDWWNYGGITRDVKIIETKPVFIADYFLQLAPDDREKIAGYIQLDGASAGEQVHLSISKLGVEYTAEVDANGLAAIKLKAEDIRYWSLDDPHLYQVTIATDLDVVIDEIGFRSIRTEGSNILLNDKSIYLRGISIHEESPIRGGRGYTLEDAQQLLSWAKELGCNYVRLAHYPHNEHMVRLADQLGMLVWEENPVYWTIDWENADTYQNAENQLAELIARDKNRASVIIWSMANETPNSLARNRFLGKLANFTKATDPTRLISAALEQKDYQGNPAIRTISDPFADIVDVLSFNQYIGWYDGLPEKCQTITWHIEQDKPVMISEFGAGAKQGFHGTKHARWTEEYQEYLYEETLQMLDKVEQIRGISPWILVDFRSPRRVLPDIQDGWNRKGLISNEGNKKKAFFVLQQYYEEKAKATRN